MIGDTFQAPSVCRSPSGEARREDFDSGLVSRCSLHQEELQKSDGRVPVIGSFLVAFFPFLPLLLAYSCSSHFFREVSRVAMSRSKFTSISLFHLFNRLQEH